LITALYHSDDPCVRHNLTQLLANLILNNQPASQKEDTPGGGQQ